MMDIETVNIIFVAALGVTILITFAKLYLLASEPVIDSRIVHELERIGASMRARQVILNQMVYELEREQTELILADIDYETVTIGDDGEMIFESHTPTI